MAYTDWKNRWFCCLRSHKGKDMRCFMAESTGWRFQASQTLPTSVQHHNPIRSIQNTIESCIRICLEMKLILPFPSQKPPAIGEWSHLQLPQLWHRHLVIRCKKKTMVPSASCNLLHQKMLHKKHMWLETSTLMGLEPVVANKLSMTYIFFQIWKSSTPQLSSLKDCHPQPNMLLDGIWLWWVLLGWGVHSFQLKLLEDLGCSSCDCPSGLTKWTRGAEIFCFFLWGGNYSFSVVSIGGGDVSGGLGCPCRGGRP